MKETCVPEHSIEGCRRSGTLRSRSLPRCWSDPSSGFSVVLPVSNLNIIVISFNISLIMVYPVPVTGFPIVSIAVRVSLPMFLSCFFPFIGRVGHVVVDGDTDIPEVTCNNVGTELVVAHTGVVLVDVDFADADRLLGLT
ncbi:hypothetical protein GUJ93_ZPchr0006g46420 [Zizania palustris]|uniref:Uncharacterized protein n=1 Tax=Zizania palustris TaxID=103762 RepID=A0A8J5T750_ZIZPA|nr:hypothetical protein GUJ93_ZPchr0006g46420 [Zizania palustris]